jgi:hypothetical protein
LQREGLKTPREWCLFGRRGKEALAKLLEKNGLKSKSEVLEEIKALRRKQNYF